VPIYRPSALPAYPTLADMKSAFKGLFKSGSGSSSGGGSGNLNSAPSGSGESGWEDFSSLAIGAGTGGARAASARVDPHPLTTDWAGRA
jgi:hypothetical protein